jgi:hypothetical protein
MIQLERWRNVCQHEPLEAKSEKSVELGYCLCDLLRQPRRRPLDAISFAECGHTLRRVVAGCVQSARDSTRRTLSTVAARAALESARYLYQSKLFRDVPKSFQRTTMASFAQLKKELDESIQGVNRYNPGNVEQLEKCVSFASAVPDRISRKSGRISAQRWPLLWVHLGQYSQR